VGRFNIRDVTDEAEEAEAVAAKALDVSPELLQQHLLLFLQRPSNQKKKEVR
jgi:hypothetical protein